MWFSRQAREISNLYVRFYVTYHKYNYLTINKIIYICIILVMDIVKVISTRFKNNLMERWLTYKKTYLVYVYNLTLFIYLWNHSHPCRKPVCHLQHLSTAIVLIVIICNKNTTKHQAPYKTFKYTIQYS
jgi:hypothetical protein